MTREFCVPKYVFGHITCKHGKHSLTTSIYHTRQPMNNSTLFPRPLVRIARWVLGFTLVVFGLNGFLQFLPQPEPPASAGRFIGAILESGYLLELTHAVEFIVGALLLVRRYVPLALVVLAPISVNIVAFHLVLAPVGFGPAALVALLNLYLLFAYRPTYAPLLRSRVAFAPSRATAPVSATDGG